MEKQKKQVKRKTIGMSVTDAEYKDIKFLAAKERKTISQYSRDKTVSSNIRAVNEHVKPLMAEIKDETTREINSEINNLTRDVRSSITRSFFVKTIYQAIFIVSITIIVAIVTSRMTFNEWQKETMESYAFQVGNRALRHYVTADRKDKDQLENVFKMIGIDLKHGGREKENKS